LEDVTIEKIKNNVPQEFYEVLKKVATQFYMSYDKTKNEEILKRLSDDKKLYEKMKNSEEFNKDNSTETNVIDPNTINGTNDLSSSYSFLEVGELIGYLTIPKINIELPIYEGVTLNNLSKGVAHMENTSLPNGDNNTHSVLAGHTGISQAIILDNLDELVLGDDFYIDYYGKKTKYEVVDIKVVLPDDTGVLKVEEGKCLVTLVTCTPKSVNTHRLLVTGQKVENSDLESQINENEGEKNSNLSETQPKTNYELLIEFIKANYKMFSLLIIVILLLFIIIGIISKIIEKIKKRKKMK